MAQLAIPSVTTEARSSGLSLHPLKRLFSYLGLSSVAVAQPLVDTIGSNPELLSATNNTGVSAWIFIVGLLTLPALITFAVVSIVGLVSKRLQRVLHYVAIGGFFALIALVILRLLGLDNDVAVLGIAVGAAAMATYLLHRFEPLQQVPQLLAFLAPALLGLFALSASGTALRASNPNAVLAGGPRETPPILFIVFDELPLWPLLDEEGQIDRERLPGLAELADSSTFYRNTVAPSSGTQDSVPAILTGLNPSERKLPPFASAYPNSLFTLLGNSHSVNAYESTTSLCTQEICSADATQALAQPRSDIKALIRDAGVIYGHKVLPGRLRSRLPRIDLAWGNFAKVEAAFNRQKADQSQSSGGETPEAELWARFFAENAGGRARQADLLLSLVDSAAAAKQPTLTFYHGLFPHRQWELTPDGRRYVFTDTVRENVMLGPDVDESRDLYQRFLMQLQFLDKTVQTAVGRLKDANVWDETMVVVVADHGFHLAPDRSMRIGHTDSADSIHDIYRVPMFVKLPGQTDGFVDDCKAAAIDLLPTIISVTNSAPNWDFDGRDLAECENQERQRFAADPFGNHDNVVDFDFADLETQMSRYRSWVDLSYGVDAFARVGSSADLVGQQLNAQGPDSTVTSWTPLELDSLADYDSGVVPAQITGTLSTTAPLPAGTEGLVMVDGTIAGVMAELGGAAAGEVAFSAIIDPALVTSAEAVFEMAVVAPDGTITMVGPPTFIE